MNEQGNGIENPTQTPQTQENYTFKTSTGKSVNAIFYPAEEIPTPTPQLRDNMVFVYGQKPKDSSDQAWHENQEIIRNSSLNKNLLTRDTHWWDMQEAIDKENALFMVEATPKNILDLVFTMGIDSPELRTLRAQISQGQVSDELLDFTDTIIAGKIINRQGQVRAETNFEGEALMVSALCGDEDAKRELAKRKQILDSADLEAEQKQIDEIKSDIPQLKAEVERQGAKEMTTKELVLIRLAPEVPLRSNSQNVLKSAFDITSVVPRTTLHFTLNHVVGAHTGGDWTGMRVAIIAPLDKAIDLNGLPRSLNTSDTYFDLTPGAPFVLPENSKVVKPGNLKDGELFANEANGTILYKATNFTPDDVKTIIEQYAQARLPISSLGFEDRLLTNMGDIVRNYWIQKLKLPKGSDHTTDAFQTYWQSSQDDIDILQPIWEHIQGDNIFQTLESETITTLLSQLEQQSQGKIDEHLALEIKTYIKQQVETQLASEVQQLAIKSVTDKSGYKWMSSSAWGGFHNNLDRLRFDLLAANLGIAQLPHNEDPNIELQGFVGADLTTREAKNKLFRDKRKNIITPELLSAISPANRRMIYQMGLL